MSLPCQRGVQIVTCLFTGKVCNLRTTNRDLVALAEFRNILGLMNEYALQTVYERGFICNLHTPFDEPSFRKYTDKCGIMW